MVKNPSFEDTITCPNLWGNVDPFVLNWKNPIISPLSSSDYYNRCAAYTTGCGVPNPIGFQNPKNGNAYCGLFASQLFSSPPNNNAREYIQGQLSTALQSGKKYVASFYVSLANICTYSVNQMGAYFSNVPITSVSYTNLPFFPQVNNVLSKQLDDTLNWMLVRGSFIANGGEQYITIGNFADDPHTDTTVINNGPFGTSNSSYYYIDDVSIILFEGLKIPNVISANGDNTNDLFYVDLLDENSHLQIFNRWGTEVFNTNNYQNNWDAKNVCAGTYFYLLITPENDIYKGFVEVIK